MQIGTINNDRKQNSVKVTKKHIIKERFSDNIQKVKTKKTDSKSISQLQQQKT
jgi:hypothetical protein